MMLNSRVWILKRISGIFMSTCNRATRTKQHLAGRSSQIIADRRVQGAPLQKTDTRSLDKKVQST